MHQRSTARAPRTSWRWPIVFLAFAAIGLFFLVSEHRIHALSWLPLLLFAACPLLHMFMHGGHSHGGHGSRRQTEPVDDGVAGEGRNA